MSCCECESLSRIASVVGIPIYVDECTKKQTLLSLFTRIVIEMNFTKTLPKEIIVSNPHYNQFKQQLVNDWHTNFCTICSVVGNSYNP